MERQPNRRYEMINTKAEGAAAWAGIMGTLGMIKPKIASTDEDEA